MTVGSTSHMLLVLVFYHQFPYVLGQCFKCYLSLIVYFGVFQNLRPSIPGDCPPAMRALIEQCWSTHPEKRPEFWQVVKVLEEFEALVARDGNFNLLQHPTSLDPKKGLRHWIQKLGPHHQHQHNSSMPKPRFS